MGYDPHYDDAIYRRLIGLGSFILRPRGGWRFGTKTIQDHVVARLIDAGHAVRQGDMVVAVER